MLLLVMTSPTVMAQNGITDSRFTQRHTSVTKSKNTATTQKQPNPTARKMAAQGFVDQAKLTLYQIDRRNLKFLAEGGYAVLNFEHKLVTAVPQKWRHKYDKYLEEG